MAIEAARYRGMRLLNGLEFSLQVCKRKEKKRRKKEQGKRLVFQGFDKEDGTNT